MEIVPKGLLPDTSAWIDFLRGVPSSASIKLASAIEREVGVFLTGLVLTEVLRGCSSDRDLRRVREALVPYPAVEPKYPHTFDAAAHLFRVARDKGYTVRSTVDCVIAATAIENNLAILHVDRDYTILAKVSPLREA